MKVRYYCEGFENPDQDYELDHVPTVGDHVELGGPDGSPMCFMVLRCTWIHHDVVPADVVLTLVPG